MTRLPTIFLSAAAGLALSFKVPATAAEPSTALAGSQAPLIEAITARQCTIATISPADSRDVTHPLKQMAERSAKLTATGPRATAA